MTRSRLLARAAVVTTAALVAPLVGCTSDTVAPDRAGTVVVAVASPFTSLNASVPDGRTGGSTLVRGLAQDELVGLDDAGSAVPDAAVGTVEKLAGSPLTVRYTLTGRAHWSDGVAVSPADLLLEWAARSGRFDEPGAPTDATSTGAATPVPAATAGGDTVRFGATSAAVVAVSATPTLDAHGITVVYDHPVADWAVDLDVNLPAHVVGRLALAGSPRPGGSAGTDPAGPPWADDEWARAVAAAIVGGDRAALVPISTVWRTGFDAAALAADPGRAVTTGPYRIESVDPASGVTLVRSTDYAGGRPPARDRVIVRWNLDPLAAVDALRGGDVDVVAPVVTPDVTAALAGVPGVRVATGGGAVLQLQLDEARGPFSAAGAGDEATAARRRAAFLGAVPAAALASAGGAAPSDVVLATVGAGRATSAAPSSGTTPATDRASAPVVTPDAAATPAPAAPVTVRVLVATGDPVRAAMLAALTAAVRPAGFEVTVADPADPATALWADPGSWDAALVPVAQTELPVAGVVDTWRFGGATNVTGHADPALDALLDQLSGTADRAAVGDGLARVDAMLRASRVVLPLGRQPSITATVARAAGSGLPDVGVVRAVPWGAVDLSSWWSWAVQAG